MQPHDKINSYLALVCEQIRWKKAHSRVVKEMENHIIDQRDALFAQGLDVESATDKAITDTGDAITIGAQLDRIHRPKPQWVMLGATAALLLLGIMVRLFIYNDADRVGSMSILLFSAGIGIAGMLIAYFADFSLLGKYPKTVYFAVAALSIVVLCIFPKVNGKSYYSQYITLLFPLAFALAVYAARNKRYIGIILCGAAFALLGFISLFTPSISGFMHFVIVGMTLLVIVIWKNWFGIKRLYGFLIMFVPVSFLAFIVFMEMDNYYHWHRLLSAFNPSLDPNDLGYWSIMTRELLNSAKLIGQGNIPDKYIVGLTEPYANFYTDSLLTALISLVGWIAFAIIVSVILFFIIKGFMLCFKQKGSLGFIVSLSIMMTFSLQAISYIVYNLGFQLIAPLSLPLISYGNSATIINLILIGFMLSVFRTGDIIKDGKAPFEMMKSKFITWDKGKLTINFKMR